MTTRMMMTLMRLSFSSRMQAMITVVVLFRTLLILSLPCGSQCSHAQRSIIQQEKNDEFDLFSSLTAPPWTSDLEEALQQQQQETHTTTNSSTFNSQCRFYMSPSLLSSSEGDSSSPTAAGWGVFTYVDLTRGSKILPSELRIPLVDVPTQAYEGIAHLMINYSWKAKWEQNEGTEVVVVIPGLSMLANGYNNFNYAIASSPTPAEPGNHSTRLALAAAAGAGSSTHYHNKQFYATQSIQRGSELFIQYGNKYTTSQQQHLTSTTSANKKQKQQRQKFLRRSRKDLRENGLCLDNMVSASAAPFGRGAYAIRNLPKDTIIAPLPLLPLHRDSLNMNDDSGKNTNRKRKQQQLLLNYCFGHPNSTLLLFPYSPVVNYINHAASASSSNDEDDDDDQDSNLKKPNAILRWSHRHSIGLEESLYRMPPSEIISSRRWGLVLELIALRDISVGEQILIDYGPSWQKAWSDHQNQLQLKQQQQQTSTSSSSSSCNVVDDNDDYEETICSNNNDKEEERSSNNNQYRRSSTTTTTKNHYVYASRLNRYLTRIRTEQEQQSKPYPPNVQTSCFYQYNPHIQYPIWPHSLPLADDDERTNAGATVKPTSSPPVVKVTYEDWSTMQQQRQQQLVPDFLRPCRVLSRQSSSTDDDKYTVEVLNPITQVVGREGRIPLKQGINISIRHVVTNLPRNAIVVTDKPYTTDMHLPNSFRHEMGLPDDVFPTQWMDLV